MVLVKLIQLLSLRFVLLEFLFYILKVLQFLGNKKLCIIIFKAY